MDANAIIVFHCLGVVEYLLSTKHLIIDFKKRGAQAAIHLPGSLVQILQWEL